MYVCICRKVTDQQIQEAIDQGAKHMRDLHQQFELGSQCGKCCQCARNMLKSSPNLGAPASA